jgi:hypothetical protein
MKSYNEILQGYNDRLKDALVGIQNLPVLESNISFNGEAEKDIVVNCDRPDNIIITSDIKKNGFAQQLPAHIHIGATEMATARVGDYIYIFGGWTRAEKDFLSNKIHRYDLRNDTVELLPTRLPFGLSGMLAVVFRNQIYLIGGYRAN